MSSHDAHSSGEWHVNQKATEPFIFRTSGLFGLGRRAWTIRDVIKHIDRYPEDGIYHLENGTLADWLYKLGAEDLAESARSVVRERGPDARAALETFLIGTGLVTRPRMVLKPRQLSLLYIMAGQESERYLRIRKGRGRGYLFGSLNSREHWLRIEPTQFGGDALDTSISVNTTTLPISDTFHHAEILIDSSATEDTLTVPVRFKVVGPPSPLERWILRPLTGFLMAGVIGGILGLIIGLSGTKIPDWLSGGNQVSEVMIWTVMVGIAWGILGGFRGYYQPLAWPVSYALRRCLLRLLIWFAGLSVVFLILYGSWVFLRESMPFGASPLSMFVLTLSLAILPASLGEVWNARSTRGSILIPTQQPLLRPAFLIAIVGLVSLLAIGGARFGASFAREVELSARFDAARQWSESRVQRLDRKINALIDEGLIRYYDMREPSRTPSPQTDNSKETQP